MREQLSRASAGLAGLILLVACGSGPAPSPGASANTNQCANGGAPHRAYVVVQHLDGSSITRCVGFTTDQIAGDQLMKQSGVKFESQHFSFGDALCAIDNEPKTFDTCLPKGAPYWGLWVSPSGGAYSQAQTGFSDVKVGAAGALGWRYTPPTEANPSPPPLPRR
ncbi:MAG: hypothetical protein M3Z13_00700 [Candidatus Dormibacteraeota bacterium]|nr:hypothetical protein [Candidatus Dormibacteraeota bacterium]